MAEISPATVHVCVLVAALVFYGFGWYATRDMSRFAKVLARLSPIGFLVPLLLILSAYTGGRPADRAQKPQPPIVQKVETARPVVELAPAAGIPETAAQAEPESKAAEPSAKSAEPEEKPAQATEERADAAQSADWDMVPVFYGTDRDRLDQPTRIAYGSGRAQRLEYGRAAVMVPKLHQVQTLQRAYAIRMHKAQPAAATEQDPQSHFTIEQLAALSREEFLVLARERTGGSGAFKDQAIVFVHGAGSAFDHALFRTAQMAYDLQFDGAAFLYSWPSDSGETAGYQTEREAAAQAEPFLRQFIDLVVRESGVQSLSIVAHSLGSLPLLQVLRDIGAGLPPGVQINQIILASPEVERDLFSELTAGLTQQGRAITLYASARDAATDAARRLAGVNVAGDVAPDGPVVMAGIDTIDISGVGSDYLALNRSVYAERTPLQNDIGLLLQTGQRPPDRRMPALQRVTTSKGDFWRYAMVR